MSGCWIDLDSEQDVPGGAIFSHNGIIVHGDAIFSSVWNN